MIINIERFKAKLEAIKFDYENLSKNLTFANKYKNQHEEIDKEFDFLLNENEEMKKRVNYLNEQNKKNVMLIE